MPFLVAASVLNVNRNRTECHFDGTDYDLGIALLCILVVGRHPSSVSNDVKQKRSGWDHDAGFQ